MTLLILFLEFFKVGLFCFGGAFGMIPVIEDTVVSRGWMSGSDFLGFIGICESTPGPIAVNMATYVGYSQGGLLGSILAVLGVVLPSFFIILLIASVMKKFMQNIYMKAVMKGVRPAVSALIIHAGLTFLFSATGLTEHGTDMKMIILFLAVVCIYFTVTAISRKKMSSVLLILISAVTGIGAGLVSEMLGA